METSKLISRIKISHLPCYLSDNESAPTPLYADSITFHEFKQLNYHSFPLESLNQVPTDVALSLQCADCPSVAKLPESASFGVVDKRTLVSKLGRAVRGYLRGDSLDRDAGKRKVKCASLEKITPDDLCLFYRYKYSAQQIKRTCDINLWLLLEKTKELFRAIKKDSIQTLLEDLSRLIVNFISSSDSDLHFTKCKYILDRLEELENIIHDRFNVNYLSTSSPSLSLSVIPSLKTVHSTPNAETSSKNTPDAFNKGQSNSLKNVNTASTTILKNSPVKPSNSANDDEEKFAYKQILSIIAQAKYTMAQMGHLLHYDRLANPNIEQLYPKDFKKKWENNTIPSPPGYRGRRKRSDSQTFASFSTAIDVNLASIDLDTEKQASSINEINTTEDLSHCSNLMRFFYCTQTFLEDFEENVVNRRKEALGKYCLWKIRKWALKYKKDKVEQKYQESELVCKICAQKVKTDKLKEHSGYCRKMAELDKELKDLELKLGDAINDTCMRSKELRTQLLVMKNEYQRLKRRNCAKSAQTSISFLSSLNFQHMKRNMSNGSVGSVDDNNTSIIDIHAQTARDIHENSFGAYEEEQQRVRGRKHGSSGEFRLKLACQEDIFTDVLNESFGPKDDNETRFKSPGNIKHSHHKSFVEKILDKYPQKYEGSPSTERFQSPSCGSQKSNKRFPSLTEKKKFAELLTKSSRSSKFYSDNGRTDSGEELDSERNVTDDDKARQNSRTNLEAQYSSEGSEALKLGFDMSSSEKSACNSPDMSNNAVNTRLTSYKKSKFFLGTGLTYDDKEEEEEEMKEELEVPREEEEEVKEDIPANEERLARLVQEKRGTRMRRTTVFMHKDDAMRDVFSGHLDRKISQELSDLRVRIENKKNANTLYEVIKAKGKIMVNQEPYQKSMEMVKDEAFKEINAIKARITDQDVVAFADNFLLALDKRIQTGKKILETQKALGMLDGKAAEESLDKALQKKFSLLRGHSSLTLTKRRLNFSSIPTIQPSNTVGEEQIFSLMKANPIKLKARSSHSNKKMFPDAPGEGNMTSLSAEQPAQNSYDFQINDKLKRYVENQQSSLVSLQEEIEDPNVSKGDVSPFGVTHFGQSSFSALEKIVQRTEEKRQSNGQAPFSLDELIANSPRDQTMRSENTDVKVTHSSLITDDSSPNTGTQTTIKESASTFSSKDVNSKTLTITLGNEEIEEKGPEEEAVRSPETPSFEAPMIWRTSTAPARTLANIRKQLVTKANTHDLAHLKDNSSSQTEEQNQPPQVNLSNNAVSISSTVAHEGLNPDGTRLRIVPDTRIPAAFEEQDHESDESKSPESSLMSRRILMRQKTKDNLSRPKLTRGFTKVEESFDDDISPGRQLNRVLHRTGSKRFMEDDSMDDIDASPTKKEESPLLIESPLLQRGYYSDSHAKKAPRTLTKQSLIGIHDFELIKMISKGAYGRVWLVRRKATNDFYAMKEINLAEKFNKNSKELENLRKENKIFGLAKEDFVVRALFTFIHETCICFVMEYMLGGDFGDILYNYCALEEEVARFYIAEIVLALEYLHSLGIVHRDLKPDNILLDKRGHAKLTDFGLSETGLSRKMAAAGSHNEGGSPSMYQKKEQAIYELCRNKDELDNNINLKLKGKVMERRATMKDLKDSAEDEKMEKNKDQKLKKPHRLIGTPDYMAPEIIIGHSFTDFSIDWFSLGVMLFEFICGVPPFNDETPEKIYDNITKLKIPWEQIQIGYEENCMSPEAADLIKKLLVLDPKERLGTNGADEIKRHPFFKGINWEKLRTQQAPIIPEHKNEIDTSNFVRLADDLKKKDQENPFNFVPKDKAAVSNRQVAKELLEAASANFSIFNYAALDLDNVRVAEEALKQKEKELNEFAKQELERADRKGIYDDIFDMPN